jgi:uncharacterized protein YbaP (TraB family)
MFRRLLHAAFACAAILAVPVHAQKDLSRDGTDTARQAEQAPKRGFFWEARKGAQRIYLLGTLHVGKAEFYPPNIEFMRRFQEAAGIVVEADVFDARRVGDIVQKMAFYPEGQPGLDTRLDESMRSRVVAQTRRFGLDTDRVWRMKPWMLANTLVLLQANSSGFSPAYATEAFLYQFATGTGKPMLEIESMELQLGLFDRAGMETQVSFLDQALRGVESGDAVAEVRRIVAAWEKRDTAAAERLIGEIHNARSPGERFVAEQLFDQRHPRMVDAIEKYAASGSVYLVAVGALHYFGPRGLLELLRTRGFTITPVS